MAIEKLNIEDFLRLAETYPVIDVRSPGEFIHAHIPGAYSLPLFTDGERKVVGTTYKQQSRKAAIKTGLDYFGMKMKDMVAGAEEIISNKHKTIHNEDLPISNSVLIHCWRGGMRSAAIAWLLDLYGFKIYTLGGGYKAFRNWVLQQFSKEYNLNVLGGFTGSGKTSILHKLKRNGQLVIDLEKLANHKGSAFGGIGEKPQPAQEMFENLLAMQLFTIQHDQEAGGIWIEDESQRIGKVIIPNAFWETMRKSIVYFLDIPFEERLNYLVNTYGNFESAKLQDSIERIQKRLGGLDTKNALQFLADNNLHECFSLLLNYYDKLYAKGLHSRNDLSSQIIKINCDTVNIEINLQKLLRPQAISL